MMNRALKSLVSFSGATIVFLGVSLLMAGPAKAVEVNLDNGETITLDSGVVKVCKDEGMNLGACACVVSIMLKEEGRRHEKHELG